jgi:hypothetical protein
MTKEEIYDQQISPLMAKIIECCREHKIAFVATYSLSSQDDEGLQCTSALPEDDCEPPEHYLAAMRLIYGRARNPLMVTTRDASGKVTRMDAILG